MADNGLLNRREFMRLLTLITGAVASYPLSGLAIERQQKEIPFHNKEPWKTLSEVQDHLFPSEENSIGAKDINALVYLQNMMNISSFDLDDKELLNNGVIWLNDLSKQQYSKTFVHLDFKKKEKILRRIEESKAGSRWISLMLTYLLQALLTDPVYGGNPDGIGWEWLHHQPGFPHPTENKKYFKLQNKRTRTIKA